MFEFDWEGRIFLQCHWVCVQWWYGVNHVCGIFWVWWVVADLCYWSVGSWIGVGVWAVGDHKNAAITGKAKVCIFMADRIQILVPSCVYTPGDWFLYLTCIQVHRSKYSDSHHSLGLCIRPGAGTVLFMVEVTCREYWDPGAWIRFDAIKKLVYIHEATWNLDWADIYHEGGLVYGIVPVL